MDKREYYLNHKEHILKRIKTYNLKHKGEKKEYDKQYRFKNRKHRAQIQKIYYLNHKKYFSNLNKKWAKENPEKVRAASRKSQKKFRKTEKGKVAMKKTQAKRKRNLGWILMFSNPFANNEKVDYHHITDTYVVAIPKDLHQLYSGKNHRKNTMEIVKQIYLKGD